MPGLINYKHILNRLQWIWIICFGCITLLGSLGLFVPHMWIPFIGFGLMLVIVVFGNYNLNNGLANCSLINHFTFYTLFLSSLIMVCINIINARWFAANSLQPLTSHIPFITSMVVYPVATVLFFVAFLRRKKTEYCAGCKEQSGHSLKVALERNVLHSESKYQLWMFMGLSALITLVVYVYYFCYYINVNINPSDRFFFFAIPTAIYVLSVAFVVTRYASMQFEVSISASRIEKESRAIIRYMVVRGDRIMLEKVVSDDEGMGLWDTPAVSDLPFTEKVNNDEAKDIFKTISGTSQFVLKKLFTTSVGMSNAFHYAAFIDADDVDVPGLEGEWFSLYEIDMMLKSGMIARPFAYEIHRVYTMTMAWKTYDRNGNRLYPIKNYRPTFRLTDFKDWEVDYDDMTWYNVANNNEDKAFFKLRKLWRRYISGNEMRWKKKRL